MANNALSDHLKIVIGESVIASSAATLSVMAFEVPVWAMFVGWISFFTRGLNLKQGVINLACVLIGVALGIAAAQVMAVLTPVLGSYAISAVVFAVTVIALSLAKRPYSTICLVSSWAWWRTSPRTSPHQSWRSECWLWPRRWVRQPPLLRFRYKRKSSETQRIDREGDSHETNPNHLLCRAGSTSKHRTLRITNPIRDCFQRNE